jgi:peptidoglycan hydrolase CwlO-like protein
VKELRDTERASAIKAAKLEAEVEQLNKRLQEKDKSINWYQRLIDKHLGIQQAPSIYDIREDDDDDEDSDIAVELFEATSTTTDKTKTPKKKTKAKPRKKYVPSPSTSSRPRRENVQKPPKR